MVVAHASRLHSQKFDKNILPFFLVGCVRWSRLLLWSTKERPFFFSSGFESSPSRRPLSFAFLLPEGKNAGVVLAQKKRREKSPPPPPFADDEDFFLVVSRGIYKGWWSVFVCSFFLRTNVLSHTGVCVRRVKDVISRSIIRRRRRRTTPLLFRLGGGSENEHKIYVRE